MAMISIRRDAHGGRRDLAFPVRVVISGKESQHQADAWGDDQVVVHGGHQLNYPGQHRSSQGVCRGKEEEEHEGGSRNPGAGYYLN